MIPFNTCITNGCIIRKSAHHRGVADGGQDPALLKAAGDDSPDIWIFQYLFSRYFVVLGAYESTPSPIKATWRRPWLVKLLQRAPDLENGI